MSTDLSVMLTASFMTQGMVTLPNFGDILKHWDGGNIELNYQLIGYAQYADALYQAGAVQVDGAGVFDYDVSEAFGDWFGRQVLLCESGTLPEKEACCVELRRLAYDCFIGKGSDADNLPVNELKAALEAVELP